MSWKPLGLLLRFFENRDRCSVFELAREIEGGDAGLGANGGIGAALEEELYHRGASAGSGFVQHRAAELTEEIGLGSAIEEEAGDVDFGLPSRNRLFKSLVGLESCFFPSVPKLVLVGGLLGGGVGPHRGGGELLGGPIP